MAYYTDFKLEKFAFKYIGIFTKKVSKYPNGTRI